MQSVKCFQRKKDPCEDLIALHQTRSETNELGNIRDLLASHLAAVQHFAFCDIYLQAFITLIQKFTNICIDIAVRLTKMNFSYVKHLMSKNYDLTVT